MNPARTKLPVTQTLHHFLKCVVPYSDLCCHFFPYNVMILSDELTGFSLVYLGRGSVWANTMRLIGNARVSIFKMLYL
jgi:hypothetical protein